MSKIQLPIAELKPALAGLAKIIGKRTTLPVLSMVHIERTKDGWITLTGTDLDCFVTVRLEEPAKGDPASILVPHDDLHRITKRCSNGESLFIEKDTGDKATIQFPIGNQNVEEHVDSLPVENFPPVPKIKSEPVALDANIRSALLEAFDCASEDPCRLILNGAYLDVSNPKCQQIVGTDGKHLYASNSFTLPLKESVIIPTNKFLGWKEFNKDGEWQLRVEPGKNGSHIQISSRRWRFITKQIEGNYPNWKQVIPGTDRFKTTVAFDAAATKDLIQNIQMLPCNDTTNHRMGVKIHGRKVSFIGYNDDKAVNVEIAEATTNGGDVVFHLNRDLLIKALGFGLCKAQIIDELSPLRFSDENGRQMIVMPIRPDAVPAAPEKSEASAPQAEQKERKPMPKTMTNGNGHQPNGDKNQLELAVEQVEAVKTSIRSARDGLNQLLETLKQVQREQKASEREVQSVRTTLEKLQSVRL